MGAFSTDITITFILGCIAGGLCGHFIARKTAGRELRSLSKALAFAQKKVLLLTSEEYKRRQVGGFLFDFFCRVGSTGGGINDTLTQRLMAEVGPVAPFVSEERADGPPTAANE